MERQLFRWNVAVSSKFVAYNWPLCIIPEELAQQFGHLSTTFSQGNQILYNSAALVLEPSSYSTLEFNRLQHRGVMMIVVKAY